MARWRLACGIFLRVTSRPFLAKMPASLASVSGAKPVQPEMPIVTLVCAIAGTADTVAPIIVAPSTAASFNIDVMDHSPSPHVDLARCEHGARDESIPRHLPRN